MTLGAWMRGAIMLLNEKPNQLGHFWVCIELALSEVTFSLGQKSFPLLSTHSLFSLIHLRHSCWLWFKILHRCRIFPCHFWNRWNHLGWIYCCCCIRSCFVACYNLLSSVGCSFVAKIKLVVIVADKKQQFLIWVWQSSPPWWQHWWRMIFCTSRLCARWRKIDKRHPLWVRFDPCGRWAIVCVLVLQPRTFEPAEIWSKPLLSHWDVWSGHLLSTLLVAFVLAILAWSCRTCNFHPGHRVVLPGVRKTSLNFHVVNVPVLPDHR